MARKSMDCIRTLLLVDLELGVEVDGGDEQVADDVESAHAVQDGRVVKGDLLADLHHHKDDHEVGAALPGQYGDAARVLADRRGLTFAGSWWR